MKLSLNTSGLPLQDSVFGASVYFPPLFKAVLLGFFIWLFLHRQLRDWMYAGDIWHPLLMDLSCSRSRSVWPGIAHCPVISLL